MKIGDVFHFRYHPREEQGWDARTHCFEGLLIVQENKGVLMLYDTFWGLDVTSNDGRRFTEEEAREKGELTPYCNLDDIEPIPSDERNYLANEDVFFLHRQHACSENCKYYFKKKGAQRSKEKMLSVVAEKILDAQARIKYAEWDIQRLSEIKTKIELGDTTVFL